MTFENISSNKIRSTPIISIFERVSLCTGPVFRQNHFSYCYDRLFGIEISRINYLLRVSPSPSRLPKSVGIPKLSSERFRQTYVSAYPPSFGKQPIDLFESRRSKFPNVFSRLYEHRDVPSRVRLEHRRSAKHIRRIRLHRHFDSDYVSYREIVFPYFVLVPYDNKKIRAVPVSSFNIQISR